MLVATPGQTTAYSTLHNNSGGGGAGGVVSASGVGSKNGNGTTVINKKVTTNLSTSNATAVASVTPKAINNTTNHTTPSANINKISLNSNTHHAPTYNYQQNSKSDNNVSAIKHSNNIINNNNKTTVATSSRDIITSTNTPATTAYSLKNENCNIITTTITTSTTISTSKQSFIQTLKDSVQKALISTTGSSSITNKTNSNSKNFNNNCNNATTSIQNVTSSSATTSSHNINKVSATTTSSTTSSNSTAAAVTQSSSSSMPLVRSKYFSCSLSKLHTVAPTVLHRYPEERQKASSTDSLQKEMCHFKPIRIAPTTPWKSGSKSRGNSLRFPKANLATKKTEFILKSNCDVNSKKKKQQQQTRTYIDKVAEDVDDYNNEQENKEFYGIYKPKPSLTCLSTSFNTPNHQSAFVCLVAQMKNLVNNQKKKAPVPSKSAKALSDDLTANMKTTKTKQTRSGRTTIKATAATFSSKPNEELFAWQNLKPTKKLVRAKAIVSAKELSKVRSTRLASNALKKKSLSTTTTTIRSKSKENKKETNAKINKIHNIPTAAAISKAKSRKKPSHTKANVINMVALANSVKVKEKFQKYKSETDAAANVEPKKTRKRKLTTEADTEAIAIKSSPLTTTVATVRARKSSRVSGMKQSAAVNQKQTSAIPWKRQRKVSATSLACFSPPLTRSRLKNLEAQGKATLLTVTELKKRF